jgi:hypothetical protein
MKSNFKKMRRIRRTIWRTIKALAIGALVFSLSVFIYYNQPKISAYIDRISRSTIDVKEIDSYYDLLARHANPSTGLILELGVKDTDDLNIAIDRLKGLMGLRDYTIYLGHHSEEKPPAYIQDLGYGNKSILISDRIKARREEFNLLVHELGHIYVERLDASIFDKCNQEKLVDCSGIYLGLGILTLNGLTDDLTFMLGGGYESEKKMFGYLTPEQFGYLVARYSAEHGIPKENVTPFLGDAGKKYFAIGLGYLNKYRPDIRPYGAVKGIYWCPKCGASTEVFLSGKINPAVCKKCE